MYRKSKNWYKGEIGGPQSTDRPSDQQKAMICNVIIGQVALPHASLNNDLQEGRMGPMKLQNQTLTTRANALFLGCSRGTLQEELPRSVVILLEGQADRSDVNF